MNIQHVSTHECPHCHHHHVVRVSLTSFPLIPVLCHHCGIKGQYAIGGMAKLSNSNDNENQERLTDYSRKIGD